ncbi:MAG TPA: hypothetical protein VNO30_28460 [Kofleriaceae bacterium]|nr:hypothetical protein [Kofleriaceae bacterium]
MPGRKAAYVPAQGLDRAVSRLQLVRAARARVQDLRGSRRLSSLAVERRLLLELDVAARIIEPAAG